MSCHSETDSREKWISVKAKLIARFGTIRRAAAIMECHPNAIRSAATEGKCPRVRKQLTDFMP